MLPPAIQIVNGTYIVPLYFPTSFEPDQVDKLGWTAIATLTWPAIVGGFALIVGTRDWKRYSYTPLSIAWLWSIALVAVGIYTRYGKYDHFLHFLAIAHVQWEWLIITYLLGYSFQQGFINATLVGSFFFLTDLGLPGIRATFIAASILGGWGDVFMPLLLWNGGQRILAIGGIGHFLNALVTYFGFVIYIPVGPYLALELIFGGLHTICTVGGIFRLQKPAIHLDEENISSPATNGKSDVQPHVIPTPSRRDIIRLGIWASVLSLATSLPLNFAPKWPL